MKKLFLAVGFGLLCYAFSIVLIKLEAWKRQIQPIFSNKLWKTYNVSGILIYTSFFGVQPWGFVREDYFSKCSCEFKNCQVLYDVSQFRDSDVVIFHGRDLPSLNELDRLQNLRNQKQLWAYFILEAPPHAPAVAPLDKYFNWSISYRVSSDFRMPYNGHKKIEIKNTPTTINYALGKTKQVAWLVSHCGAARDKLAKKLEEYGIQVDVGGQCSGNYKGKLHCSDKFCVETLKQYKFYFSAENTFCEDYVTEKYFLFGLKGNTIPIVLGGANYSNPKIAIPGSYINPQNFRNVKEFVEHLKLIDKNDTMFNEYFKWKTKWKQEDDPAGCQQFVCDICKRLNSRVIGKSNSLSAQMESNCKEPTQKYEQWINAI